MKKGLWERAKTYDQVQHTRLTVIVALHSVILVGGVEAINNKASPWLVIGLAWFGVTLLLVGAVIVRNLDVRIRAVNDALGDGGNLRDDAHAFWINSGCGDGLSSTVMIGQVFPALFFAAYAALILAVTLGPPA